MVWGNILSFIMCFQFSYFYSCSIWKKVFKLQKWFSQNFFVGLLKSASLWVVIHARVRLPTFESSQKRDHIGWCCCCCMNVMWILPNLVDYGKIHLWPWVVGWINWASKQAYGSILSAYVKRSIEYSIRLIMELFCAFWAKIRSFKGKPMFIDFNGAISSIMERKEDKYVFYEAHL